MDSSFIMDVGETVVVGTSRPGGDKALIALRHCCPASIGTLTTSSQLPAPG